MDTVKQISELQDHDTERPSEIFFVNFIIAYATAKVTVKVTLRHAH